MCGQRVCNSFRQRLVKVTILWTRECEWGEDRLSKKNAGRLSTEGLWGRAAILASLWIGVQDEAGKEDKTFKDSHVAYKFVYSSLLGSLGSGQENDNDGIRGIWWW